MKQQKNFLHLEIRKGRVWRGARRWGPLTPHGLYPVVWTIYKADSSIKYVFSSQTGLGAISRCSCPRDVWRVPERLSSQTGLLDEAYEGGRGRQLTDASHSVAAGAVGGLRWRVVIILHGKHLSEGPQACLALESRVKAPFILTLPLFLSSSLKGFDGGQLTGPMWVPMGMVALPTAPERWGSSVVSFSRFTAAGLSHDMTHR